MAKVEGNNPYSTNDSKRPCWGFLSRVLGRALTPPATADAGRAELRALLEEALRENPYRLFGLAIMSSEGMREKMQSFVNCLCAETSGTTVFEGENFDQKG